MSKISREIKGDRRVAFRRIKTVLDDGGSPKVYGLVERENYQHLSNRWLRAMYATSLLKPCWIELKTICLLITYLVC